MKKTALIATLCLLLCACARPAPGGFSPRRYFTAPFLLTHGDYEIEGTVKCNSFEDLAFTFTHPAALSFITVRASSAGLQVDAAGAEDLIPAGDLPASAPIGLLAEALRQTLFTQTAFTADETGYTSETAAAGLRVICAFTPDGAVRSVQCPAADLKIEFGAPQT
jgi:hypothetical protein